MASTLVKQLSRLILADPCQDQGTPPMGKPYQHVYQPTMPAPGCPMNSDGPLRFFIGSKAQ